MKTTLIMTLALISFNCFASFNEVECRIVTPGSEILVEIEQPFPSTSIFRNLNLSVTRNGNQADYSYTVTSRRTPGFNQIQYMGPGLRLEVDHWPDNIPRWGRTYRGSLTASSVFNNQTVTNLECQFPNASF